MTDTATGTLPVINPNSPDYLANPYPLLAQYRAQRPVAEVSLVPGRVPPTPWVFRYADVKTVLEGTAQFIKHSPVSNPTPPPPPPAFWTMAEFPPGLLSSDPPRHDLVRGAVEPSFTTALAGADAVAEQVVNHVIDSFSGTNAIELVQQFAYVVPATVLAHVLGLPPTDLPGLMPWVAAAIASHNIVMPASIQATGATCAMALRTYYDGLVQEMQGTPGAGMLGGVCAHIGRELQLHDVQSVMSDMLIAGYTTTTFLISTGIHNLLSNPEQFEALRSDMTLLPNAVEEMLRFDPPAQMLDRYVATPASLSGVDLQPGQPIVLNLASANRDPDVFADPETFDIHRTEHIHFGFGHGIHECIGAPLARITTPHAIKGLVSRLQGLQLAGQPQFQPDPYLRGLTNLPLSYDKVLPAS